MEISQKPELGKRGQCFNFLLVIQGSTSNYLFLIPLGYLPKIFPRRYFQSIFIELEYGCVEDTIAGIFTEPRSLMLAPKTQFQQGKQLKCMFDVCCCVATVTRCDGEENNPALALFARQFNFIPYLSSLKLLWKITFSVFCSHSFWKGKERETMNYVLILT